MLTRRLYLQIYVAILASLVLTLIVTGILWNMLGRDRAFQEVYMSTGRLAQLMLANPGAPRRAQRSAIQDLGAALQIDISLFDANRRLIANYGKPSPPPPPHLDRRWNWNRMGQGSKWVLHLPDGRWLVADLGPRGQRRPLGGILLLLGSIAFAVALVAFPFARRLTRRLERLQKGVEKIGSGDLTARVVVEGRDEVASLARSFNTAADRIQKLVGAHRMLLANASHELRTPLARIRLGIEMIREGFDPEREAALRTDIAELESLIDEILLMSRLESHPDSAHREIVDVLALAAEECARYEDCKLRGTTQEIRGDPQLLRRLIRNLLENARLHGQPPIEVSVSREDEGVVLAVSNRGEGPGGEEREKVFQPFYRSADRQNVRGYGLGLPLVRQIAESHGGTAYFAGTVARRTTVRVELPAHSAT